MEEINETETRKMIEKIYELKTEFTEKIYKINKQLD
jgi:hypothetical protein